MRTALVAGGAGFIGSHLCEALLERNYRVICVDNLITGNKNNIEKFTKDQNFTFIEHDITQSTKGQRLQIPHVDHIFHLASPASPNKKSPRSYIALPIETLLVNSAGTYNLLELASADNAAFLFASSSEIYGDPLEFPQKETYFGNVNPNGTRSVYDESKRFGEAMTFAHIRKFGINARVVRIFNTYGPYMQKDDGRVVSSFVNQAINGDPITVYGDGTQTRSFCFVSDMADGIVKAMETDSTSGEVINLGNPDERKVIDLAEIIKEMTKSKSAIIYEELPQDDPRRRLPDITKAKTLLAWQPKVSLEEGLKKTIEYFKHV